jgi:enterochelin esterase-like enzyme
MASGFAGTLGSMTMLGLLLAVAVARPPVAGNLQVIEGFKSKTLGEARTIRVWLPPGHNPKSTKKWPVLYLMDGQNVFDPRTAFDGQNEWRVDETMESLIRAKVIVPMVVVAVDHGGIKRIDEYTPCPDPKYKGGNGKLTATFLIDEVMPMMQRDFGVSSDRNHVGIGGSSLGGLMALWLARTQPTKFGRVLAMSPSLWWNSQWEPSNWKGVKIPKGTRVWLDTGTSEGDDTLDQATKFARALTGAGAETRFYAESNAEHREEAWARRFPMAVSWLYR